MFIRIERNHLVEALGKALAVSGAKGNVWIDAVSGPSGGTSEDDPGVLVIAMPLDIADDGWSQFE